MYYYTVVYISPVHRNAVIVYYYTVVHVQPGHRNAVGENYHSDNCYLNYFHLKPIFRPSCNYLKRIHATTQTDSYQTISPQANNNARTYPHVLFL